ncbi:protein of unknown function [Methylocaldum szegediense]|uniref:Uncharacterized protein n=1 Tax=Methylocaldum szegediense TaxID=73780 RepID=A0ABM9I0S4_9GAMM|nr:protein of unknown function [Methylocaldum szegediense]
MSNHLSCQRSHKLAVAVILRIVRDYFVPANHWLHRKNGVLPLKRSPRDGFLTVISNIGPLNVFFSGFFVSKVTVCE